MNAQTGEQIKIVCEFDKLTISHHLSAKRDDKRFTPKSIDIGGYRTEPGNEFSRVLGKRR
jgi:hypothetical protein